MTTKARDAFVIVHPECLTAREAWEADGHDVAEIDLAEAI